MGRRAFVSWIVIARLVLFGSISISISMMFGCVRSARPIEPARIITPTEDRSKGHDDEQVTTGLSLASFADELALSLEPSKLEDETTATEVYVFNRGSRTWVIALETTPDGKRSLELEVRDVAAPDRDLPPAPIGITAQCPRAPSKDVHVVGPGERGLIACVEKLVDVRNVDELELEVGLQFTAADGSEIRVRSPAFRVARRPTPPIKTKKR